MKKSDAVMMATFAGVLAAGTLASTPAHAVDNEKCAGIVKAGKNDCAYGANACAASATQDGEKDAWIYVPKGTCEKIVGGTVVDKKVVDKK